MQQSSQLDQRRPRDVFLQGSSFHGDPLTGRKAGGVSRSAGECFDSDSLHRHRLKVTSICLRSAIEKEARLRVF